MKELEQFLLDRAMEHDSPTLLFNLAREYLMSAKVGCSQGKPETRHGLILG